MMPSYRATQFTRTPARLAGAVLAWSWLAGRRAAARVWQFVLMRRPRANESRIVVFRLGSMGDHLAALPVLEAIRRRHPEAEMTLLTNAGPSPPWPEVVGVTVKVRAYANVGGLRDLLAELRPTAVYYLAPQPFTLRRAVRDCLFFAVCGVRRGTGFTPVDATGAVARALRPWRESEPQHERLARACGLACDPVPAPPVKADGPVALVPAGKSAVQHWPPGSFRRLAEMLRAGGVPILWIGGPQDAARALECGAQPGDTNLVGSLDINDCAESLSRCRAVVSNDTGLAHLAARVGAPLVVVASSRDAVGAWRPFGVPSRVRVLRSDVACESCHRRECESLICLRLIEPEHVLDALVTMNVAVANGPQSTGRTQSG